MYAVYDTRTTNNRAPPHRLLPVQPLNGDIIKGRSKGRMSVESNQLQTLPADFSVAPAFL